MKNKVAIIGSGNVGTSVAILTARNNIAEISLLDISASMAEKKAEEIRTAGAMAGYSCQIKGGNDYALMENADLVIITAGHPRKPGMTRDDLLQVNGKIVHDVSEKVRRHAPKAIVIMITNPLDAMTYIALKTTGFETNRIMGMAGILDSTRFQYFLSETAQLHPSGVSSMVLGGHGDAMVPLADFTTLWGLPARDLLDSKTITSLAERTRQGGGEMIGYLQTGAYWAPAASISEMIVCILKDQKRILPCSAYLQGEYGYRNFFMGVPVVLGRDGVETIIELVLTAEETAFLSQSAANIQNNVKRLKELSIC